jgi:hypothetical protein
VKWAACAAPATICSSHKWLPGITSVLPFNSVVSSIAQNALTPRAGSLIGTENHPRYCSIELSDCPRRVNRSDHPPATSGLPLKADTHQKSVGDASPSMARSDARALYASRHRSCPDRLSA